MTRYLILLPLRTLLLLSVIFLLPFTEGSSQELSNLGMLKADGLRVGTFISKSGISIDPDHKLPAFSFDLNGKKYSSADTEAGLVDNRFLLNFPGSLFVTYASFGGDHPGWAGEITFENNGLDTLVISNVVPFGEQSVFIRSMGNDRLARAWLFRDEGEPVRVILPDNAWELGYSGVKINDTLSLCAIARRRPLSGGIKRRFETLLPPGAKAVYILYGDFYRGEWQNGLRKMFRDRMIYDIPSGFDSSLYNRDDLAWIRSSYLSVLLFAWDKEFYNRDENRYTFPELVSRINERFGYADFYGIWPTWPRLGLDKRNQWDMYTDLPGGTMQLRNFSRLSRQYGSRFFIAYNPWDKSTRQEDHLYGLSKIIRDVEADGVVLDTRGNSGPELQYAADTVRKGVIMYSEGMAVPNDMEGIIAGRVHNAIFLSPELNLNKLIKPEFSIFRVADIGEDVVHREIAIALFNGYGTELNMFRPGRREVSFEEDLDFLSATTFILRQNSDAFLDREWTPLIASGYGGLLLNRWVAGSKTIYTVLSTDWKGVDVRLPIPVPENYHAVSLWHHNALPKSKDGIPVVISGWPRSFSGTRREGSVDVIAIFPETIKAIRRGDSLHISMKQPGMLRIWDGKPSYSSKYTDLSISTDTTVNIADRLKFFTGPVVLQHIENNLLRDELIVPQAGNEPWLVSRVQKTAMARSKEAGMVTVPGAQVKLKLSGSDNFIPYPFANSERNVRVDSFMIDIYPVTNLQYNEFLQSAGYVPRDTANWLSHWSNGIYKNGQENYPVVNISLEDAEAYAKWIGKRLPTEAEWQLAAQGTDGRKWPWGNEFHGTKCNNAFDRPTPVNAFPKGNSPYGVADLVGNIWQMTADKYSNGSNYYIIIRGGSYFKPESSWWYIPGGPQQLDKTQMLLMVSPGFDRSEVVGFRCVKDMVR